jgi:hypothetical protein
MPPTRLRPIALLTLVPFLALSAGGCWRSFYYAEHDVPVKGLTALNRYRAPSSQPVLLPLRDEDPYPFTADAELVMNSAAPADCSTPPVCASSTAPYSPSSIDAHYTRVDVNNGQFHGVTTDGRTVNLDLRNVDSAEIDTFSNGRLAAGIALGAIGVVACLTALVYLLAKSTVRDG